MNEASLHEQIATDLETMGSEAEVVGTLEDLAKVEWRDAYHYLGTTRMGIDHPQRVERRFADPKWAAALAAQEQCDARPKLAYAPRYEEWSSRRRRKAKPSTAWCMDRRRSTPKP
jgi:hypothetical protein